MRTSPTMLRRGVCRFSVQLARHFAAHGFTSLRFDLAGLGDSPVWPRQKEGLSWDFQELLNDIQSAMSLLSERGLRKFVLIGLCSGATLSILSALGDTRVCGVALLNEQGSIQAKEAPNWTRHHPLRIIQFYRQSISNQRTWKRMLTGEIDLIPPKQEHSLSG